MKIFITEADLAIGKSIEYILRQIPKNLAALSKADADGDEDQDEQTQQNNEAWMSIEVFATVSTKPAPKLPSGIASKYTKSTVVRSALAHLEKYSLPGELHESVQLVEDDQILQTVDQCDVVFMVVPDSQNSPSSNVISRITSHLSQKYKGFDVSSNGSNVPPIKTVVLVSNVLSWFRCNLTDSESGLTEDDYRKRKAHPDFKWQIDMERAVTKLSPVPKGADDDDELPEPLLKSYVVASGIVIHPFDGVFHSLLKKAWSGEDLVCYGSGENVLPTIHLHDLCNTAVRLAQIRPQNRYILAVDESNVTYGQLLQAISESLGTGNVRNAPQTEALLDSTISATDHQLLNLNLRLDATTARELAEFVYDSGPIDNMLKIVKEYLFVRDLYPACILILGPPMAGKSTVAAEISKHYGITHINTEKALELFLALEGDAELQDKQNDMKQLFEGGKVSDAQMASVLHDVMKKASCRNQGYILDGFPETFAHAEMLFGDPDSKLHLPTLIIDLEISDEAIKRRVSPGVSEENTLKRLETYRQLEKADEGVLDFFDQRDIHAISINAEQSSVSEVLQIVQDKVGHIGYDLSKEEIEKEFKAAAADESDRAAKEKGARDRLIAEENARREEQEKEWKKRVEQLKQEEKEMLEARSAPLKKYLVENVMPALTSALVDVAKIRPDDPVDFVAEHLLKQVRAKLDIES